MHERRWEAQFPSRPKVDIEWGADRRPEGASSAAKSSTSRPSPPTGFAHAARSERCPDTLGDSRVTANPQLDRDVIDDPRAWSVAGP